MTRATYVVWNDEMRERLVRLVKAAPKESRITFQGPKRTLDQNAKLHAMIGDIALQKQLCGQWLGIREWKGVFCLALGHEMKMVPTIDENGFFPLGVSTSDLSTKECSDLIELLYAKGAEWEIVWSEPEHWHNDLQGCTPPQKARGGFPVTKGSEVPAGASDRPPSDSELGPPLPEVGSAAALKAPEGASSSPSGAKRRLTADEAVALLPLAKEVRVMVGPEGSRKEVRWLRSEAETEIRAASIVGWAHGAPDGFPLGIRRSDNGIAYLEVHR